MKKIALLFPLAFATNLVFAQRSVSTPAGADAQRNLDVLASDRITGIVRSFDNRYQGVDGTPYFLDEWGTANLNTTDNKIYENIILKYNVFNNTFLYQNSKGKLMQLEAFKVNSFVLKDSLGLQAFNFRKENGLASVEPNAANHFVVVLHEGKKGELLLLPTKTFLKADYKGPYASDRKQDQIVEDFKYFFKDQQGNIQKVKLSRKSLLNSLSDKKKQVQAFISDNRIDASTEAGWVKALAFYETL